VCNRETAWKTSGIKTLDQTGESGSDQLLSLETRNWRKVAGDQARYRSAWICRISFSSVHSPGADVLLEHRSAGVDDVGLRVCEGAVFRTDGGLKTATPTYASRVQRSRSGFLP
jgi:hypothetical protein